MIILVDTNVWLRAAEPRHPQSGQAATALIQIVEPGHQLVVAPQVLFEFWVVATRAVSSNSLGRDPVRANLEIDGILRSCSIVHDDSQLVDIWRGLVTTHSIVGKPAHDARLVAAMIRHGVTHLLTFNTVDFARFSEIIAIAPGNAGAVAEAST